jgi:hypothetical protein
MLDTNWGSIVSIGRMRYMLYQCDYATVHKKRESVQLHRWTGASDGPCLCPPSGIWGGVGPTWHQDAVPHWLFAGDIRRRLQCEQ